MKTLKFLILSGLLALFLSGCGVMEQIYSYQAAWGSTFTNSSAALRTIPATTGVVTKEVDFYFSSGSDQYRNIPEDLYSLFISDARWSASEGIKLQDPTFKVSNIDVTWKEGDSEYRVPGVRITIQVQAILDESISLGQKGIYVEFPNIKYIAKAMNVQPKTGINPLEERILVSQVNVHSMEYLPMLAIYIPIGIIVFGAIGFGWNWLQRRGSS